MSLFQKNPLTMRGRVDRCWLFTFRTPEEAVRGLIPPGLELVSRGGFAFWNVVVSEVDAMRPKGVPAVFGMRYRHVAYRLYVRYKPNGNPLEGLYFLRSDCDSRLISAAGNRMTDFGFHHGEIDLADDGDELTIDVRSPDACAHAVIDRSMAVALGPGTPFDSIYQAKAVLKYKPCAMAPTGNCKMNIVTITRDEEAWCSKLVHVREQEWAFFRDKPVEPEICYEVDPIDYQWNRGRLL